MNALYLFVLLSVIGEARADGGACYSISNPESRAYCLARAHKNASYCYSIPTSDLRAICLAEFRR